MRKYIRSLVLSLAFVGCLAPYAHADLFGVWLKPKFDFVSGTGEVFKRFEGQPAGGVEAGVELLGISLWGDMEWMANSQYLGSVNLGYDFSIGKKIKFTLGGYGGIIFFGFPSNEESSSISDEQRAQIMGLLSPVGVSYDVFEDAYQDNFGALDQVSDKAAGVNFRARASLEYQLMPLVSVGVQGGAGYHFLISGEEFANSAKSLAVDAFIEGQPLDDSMKDAVSDELKSALGADDSSTSDFTGVNYSVGAFVNLSF